MSEGRAYVDFVVGSSVRSDVLCAIARRDCGIEDLLDRLDASESAVYGAVSDLEDRGFIVERDSRYVLTGSGRMLSDVVQQLDATGTLIDDDPDYWQTHRLDVLPERFRREVRALAGCEVVRATDTDPHRVVRTVAERIETAEHASIASPIYQDEYAMQLPEVEDVRLVLHRAVVEDAAADVIEAGIEPPPNVSIRVTEIEFALTVTDSCVMLSLPDVDGQYDTRTEVIAGHDAALDWGRRLYEHCWERAIPIDEFEGIH